MPNLLDYINYRLTAKQRILDPVFNGIAKNSWFVALGSLLPDESGLRVGGQDLLWPSPAHEAVWRAARYGFSDETYDDVLRTQGILNTRGFFSPDAWTANVIAPLSSNARIHGDASTIRDPRYTQIARWTWHWNWVWNPKSGLHHKTFVNPANPHEIFVVPGVWAIIANDLTALPEDESLGVWIAKWAPAHEKFYRKYGWATIFYALTDFVMLLGALQAAGAGYLDLLPPEAIRAAEVQYAAQI